MALSFEIEATKMAVRSITERKLRSGLTAIGIVIGVAAIIALMSIGAGTQAYIDSQFKGFGANRIIVSPITSLSTGTPSGSGTSLSQKDVTTVLRVRGVALAIPIYVKSISVKFKDSSRITSLYGVNSQEAESFFSTVSAFQVDTGRFLRSGDKYSAVIGSQIAKNGFPLELHVRDKVFVNNKSFEIVGIMKETGSSQDDNMVIVPIESLRELFGVKDTVTVIFTQAQDGTNVDDVAAAIQAKFDQQYGKKTFTVLSTTQLAGQISAITGTLTLVLSGIAGIALVVAGIGIANTMYMSTLERTKEIGIMKAIGATNRNILEIFLLESALIGLTGGILGVGLGTAASYGLGVILSSLGTSSFKTLVTPDLALMGVGFAVAVGVMSGILPSRSAARKNPIEALRYE
jgi:putative ABC transport system permease protein